MRYRIDTHVCLWAVAEPQKLSPRVQQILENPKTEIRYSQASLLEIAIKFQAGKLPNFTVTLEEFNNTLQQKGFILQPISNDQLFAYFTSTFFSEQHRDPFDRFLLAIAAHEQVRLITKDEKFDLYKSKIQIIW